MTPLWIGIAAMSALAAIFVLLPLVRNRNQAQSLTEAELSEHNVAMFRQRLEELNQELAQGNLLPEQFEQMKSELEQTLLDDVGDKEIPVLRSTRPGILLSLVLISLILVSSVGWYFVKGNSGGVALALERQNGDMPSVEELVGRLEQSLKQNPDSADGWFLLARTYMNMGRFADAADAIKEVIRIDGRTAVALAQYAQALYFANQNVMTPEIDTLLDEALQADPNEAAALGLRGISAFESGAYREAIGYWQQALQFIGDPNSANAIRAGVSEAARRLEAQGESVDTASAGSSIKIQVDLSDAAKAAANPADTVFVFARAPQGGPPMPLAAARLSVADLPVTITLDDSMAVAPMVRLSSATEVNLAARIAKAGTPEPQPGDWQGVSGPYPVNHKEVVKLVITDQIQ
ncbi:c-type cytochrome biogenesis protein CcmI [Oceanospirillum linum]|uniref:C-type cytochrome biogenesis protein CcmI n=1 Tax=Oceanospirillum linum TaxID=966 RepID=A0A1T1HFF4_OCELI|nr:c-type cytochrome biogenesis protein CcmI [Oceanospirillum linum]OOV88546.1 c-type cytochrome biogenesis protein CcmI [Oceanospirillum linum]SEF60266.1 cytochrome c-type biogenesis protein CcmH [Oleiphilus messinensis]SMP06921.1 cytochrome c-type biogenesis protein CcmH [Oceanospirillum linum]